MSADRCRDYRNAVKRHHLVKDQQPSGTFRSVPPSVKLPNSSGNPIGET
jgi:hypothetical protein